MSAALPSSPAPSSGHRRIPRPAAEDLAAAAMLGIVPAALYWRVLFAGEVFFGRDVGVFFHSQAEAFFSAVRSGAWPVWNPWAGFGQPMLANANTETLYPPTWLLLIVPTAAYHAAHALAHLWWGGLGVYALARHLGTSRGGALVAGAGFILSGPILSLLEVLHLAGASWIPWVVLAAGRALESRRVRDAVVWGLVVTAQVLAGSPDMCALGAAATAAWCLGRLRGDARHGVLPRTLAAAALAAAVAIGLSAAQWLPTAAAARGGLRAALPFEERAFWSVHPLTVPQLLLPVSLLALPQYSAGGAALFEVWEPFLRSLYLGAAFLGLAAAAFVPADLPRRATIAWIGAAALIVGLGRHTPMYAALAAAIPPMRLFRFPAKALVLLALAWALLAGFGFDQWRRAAALSASRWRGLVVAALGLVAAAAGAGAVALSVAAQPIGRMFLTPVAGGPSPGEILAPASRSLAVTFALSSFVLVAAWRPARAASWAPAVAAVAVLDLVRAHAGLNVTVRPEFYRYRPPVLDTVAALGTHPRVFVWDYVLGAGARHSGMLRYFVPQGVGREAAIRQGLALQQYLYPPAYVRWGLFGSFDPDLLGLAPPPTKDLVQAVRALEGTPGYARLLRIGAVDAVVALHDDGQEELEGTSVAGLTGVPIRVFRVPGRQPRLYLVGSAVRADGERALEALLSPDFDPARQVVLPASERTRFPAVRPGFAPRLTVEEERPDLLRLSVDMSDPGWLVRVSTFDPGWKARVDGVLVPLLRANHAFQAVPLTAGRHAVELRYRPTSLLLGAAVSLVTAFVVAAGGVVAVVRRAA
jgi:Bacterial membrane protein YfhO